MPDPSDDRTPAEPTVLPSSPSTADPTVLPVSQPDPTVLAASQPPADPVAEPLDPMADPMAALLGGGGDLSGLLQAAQEMQAELANAQAQAAETIVEGVAGGGVVRIEATAGLEFQRVHVRPDALEGGDAEMLEDLILAALRDVVAQANQVHSEALGDLGGLGGMLPGA